MKLDKLLNGSVHPTLKEAYDEIYKMNTDDQPHSQALAVKALKWVLCSFRPLSTNELADAGSAIDTFRHPREILARHASIGVGRR